MAMCSSARASFVDTYNGGHMLFKHRRHDECSAVPSNMKVELGYALVLEQIMHELL